MTLATPVLHTARLRLRPFTDADADSLFALHSSTRVMRYWAPRRGPNRPAPSASSRCAGRWRTKAPGPGWPSTVLPTGPSSADAV
ncbi:GNAT family N-acetyltransferase [Kitasatospora sp. NPDC058402]